MKRAFFAGALGASCIAFALIACGDDDDNAATADAGVPETSTTDTRVDPPDTSTPAAPQAVTLKFKAMVGTEAFKCGTTYSNLGSTNDTVTPRDLRFFVQDVKLLDAQGNATPVKLDARAPWQTNDLALLDFEDGTGLCANGNAELNAVVTGTVPAGTYTGIRFTNGVPSALNYADPATATEPLTAGGMTWGWLYGHLFIKAEMASTSADGGIGLLHLGSTGCTNSVDGGPDDFQHGPTMACAQANLNLVQLADFDATKNTVIFDVKTLFATTDLTADNQCHSDGTACPPLFANVGLDFDGGARMPTAAAFRVE